MTLQQRVDALLKYGRTLTDERREQLLSADIKVTVEPETSQEDARVLRCRLSESEPLEGGTGSE